MTRDMKATMPYIHYSNPIWDKPRTIWGAAEEGLQYEYSDRLWQWDRAKAEDASKKAAKKAGKAFTPKYIQEFLKVLLGEPVELLHIKGGVNTNGYTYYIYGFRVKEKAVKKKKVSSE
jgi:hypothetical protein